MLSIFRLRATVHFFSIFIIKDGYSHFCVLWLLFTVIVERFTTSTFVSLKPHTATGCRRTHSTKRVFHVEKIMSLSCSYNGTLPPTPTPPARLPAGPWSLFLYILLILKICMTYTQRWLVWLCWRVDGCYISMYDICIWFGSSSRGSISIYRLNNKSGFKGRMTVWCLWWMCVGFVFVEMNGRVPGIVELCIGAARGYNIFREIWQTVYGDYLSIYRWQTFFLTLL